MSDVVEKYTVGVNELGSAASAYLRSARHQPVAWNEWGPEAFARAAAANKPILLDIGAVWCHWCHVMDRESYEDLDTAAVINDFYIAVKVDRDERPDVDARYQAAVAAISGQGGWPLTVFLTPEGKPYFGGGYFPPEERYGRPSFQRVLLTMADAFANQRENVEESADGAMEAIEQSEAFTGPTGKPDAELLEKMVAAIVGQFDERNGGFGSQPKFPHAGALELLIDAVRGPTSQRRDVGHPDSQVEHVVTTTLKRMASGGVYDQLGGGFHRYSVDERWVVPHFEKLAYDNSELLKVYARAWQAFGDAEFERVGRDMLRWMDECLSDRERGGFYASQQADDSPDDDGGYFTWTLDEARAVLTEEEFAVAVRCFHLRPVGDMQRNPQKNVLRREAAVAEIDAGLFASVKAKMYAARLQRRTPLVDRTIYTGWNGMCIAAYLQAGRAFGVESAMAFAVKSLDRLLAGAWDAELGLGHVVAYGDGVVPAQRVAGMLEDYAFVAGAALDAWEATGELRYSAAARAIADAMLLKFCDVDAADGVSRGFFDTERGMPALGALSARRKPLQDAPTPSGNAVAAMVLLRLHALSGEEIYRQRALETLETFAGVAEHLGLYGASYGLTLAAALHTQAVI